MLGPGKLLNAEQRAEEEIALLAEQVFVGIIGNALVLRAHPLDMTACECAAISFTLAEQFYKLRNQRAAKVTPAVPYDKLDPMLPEPAKKQ